MASLKLSVILHDDVSILAVANDSQGSHKFILKVYDVMIILLLHLILKLMILNMIVFVMCLVGKIHPMILYGKRTS
jgi:hypothetical protein